jgi:pimeloyl-ACP methyl ester carboxylesterase
VPGVVLCHGFPSGALGALQAARSYPELGERIATELGWVALAFAFRGAGASEGDFSLGGWQADIVAACEHVRSIRTPNFPSPFEAWARELRSIRAAQCVAELVDRPLLVVHGTDDDLVPDFDARVVADTHGSAELRLVGGAGHQLRHDPRAVAILLGWLDRQRHGSVSATVG